MMNTKERKKQKNERKGNENEMRKGKRKTKELAASERCRSFNLYAGKRVVKESKSEFVSMAVIALNAETQPR